MESSFERHSIVIIRFLCLGIFLYASICFTVQSFISLLALIVSVLVVEPTKSAISIRTNVIDISKNNPLRGKLNFRDRVKPSSIAKFQQLLSDSLTYDATKVEALKNFSLIQSQSQCLFAKTAKLWGSADYQTQLSLEENIRRSFPTFLKFTCVCKDLGLDGFVFEFPGSIYGQSVEMLGEAVRKLLHVISELNPIVSKSNCNDWNIEQMNWVFELNEITFFITTFAPCYSVCHSRFAFGASNSYVLFQPELSFARHDLPPDTLETCWSRPKTIRDRIRVAFQDAGRPYTIRDTIRYPMAWDIVKPLNEGGNLVKWWIKEDEAKDKESVG